MCISFYKGIPDCKTRTTDQKGATRSHKETTHKATRTTNTGRPPVSSGQGGSKGVVAAVCGTFAKPPASSPKWDAKIRTTQANGTARFRRGKDDTVGIGISVNCEQAGPGPSSLSVARP